MEEGTSGAGSGVPMPLDAMRHTVMEASALARLALPPCPEQVAFWLAIEPAQARAVLDRLDDEGMIDTTRGFRAWSEFAMLEMHDRRTAARRPLPEPPAWDRPEPDRTEPAPPESEPPTPPKRLKAKRLVRPSTPTKEPGP